ncbi:MAG TPA: carboxypeptidase-like regulatory domain-containing protein, partial [Bryobacteraceae bacterium]|nr:carboxypeptidase-like regulatory domain-containing protein [Bryobacteraceae bacterium]
MRRILAALLFTSFPALSQVTSGTITGVVKDPSDSTVVDAKVEARNPATGLVRTVRTSGEGVFVVPNLQPGEYTIAVEAPGFQTLEKTGIFLAAADRLN